MFVERKSRFIGRARPIRDKAEFSVFLEELRRIEWEAAHHCYAYILRAPVLTRHSDNGEPQGTAGLPILQALRHAGLYGACCVVTRYFGGVLLGTGGLTRAYGRAAREAIEAAGLTRMDLWRRVPLDMPYALLDTLRRRIEGYGGAVEDTRYEDTVRLTCWLPAGVCEDFCAQVVSLSAGRVSAAWDLEAYRTT